MRYIPAFDGLRAVAVILVLLFHQGYIRGGWVGVDIFFTLSGYLITLILMTEYETTGSIAVPRFYIRRACRLLPALVVVLCVAVVLAIYLDDKIYDTEIDAVAGLLYIINYRYAFFPVDGTALGHLWSLSVEEQFYLFWPFILIALLSHVGRKIALYTILILTCIVITWRFVLLAGTTHSTAYRIYFSFDTRMDEILIGCSLALWGYRPRAEALRLLNAFLPVVVGLIVVIVVKAPVLGRLSLSSYPLIGAAVAYTIVIVTSDAENVLVRLLSLPPIVALGRISYGVYLWHYLIIQEVRFKSDLFTNQIFLIAGLTLTAAVASFWLIERPFLRLKSFYKPSTAIKA